MRECDNHRGNHVLGALAAAGCEDLEAHMELVPMPVGRVVYGSGAAMRHAYFPTTSIMSMLYIMNDGTSDEIATVGAEGFVGVQLFLGCETIPSRALVRSAGHAYRLDAAVLQREFNRSAAVQHLLLRYMQSLLAQISQTAACNRHHSINQRLCRWLLSSLDRLPSNELQTTHESIGEMLNVRRESITQELGELKAAGLIQCQRGRITVIDRAHLEARACECYKGIKKEFIRLLGAQAEPALPSGLQQIWNSRGTDVPQRFGLAAIPAAPSRAEEDFPFVRRYSPASA